MSDWTLVYSLQAQKDAKQLASSGLKQRAERLLDLLAEDPIGTPPRYEKLVGDLSGCYSRRINIQHRLVYEVYPDRHVVHVLRMWTHHELAVAVHLCHICAISSGKQGSASVFSGEALPAC